MRFATRKGIVVTLAALAWITLLAALPSCNGRSDAEPAHKDHDEHEEPGEHADVIKLTPEQLKDAGVVIAPLAGATIAHHLTLPGEVGFNIDKLAHITPRVPGIAAEVHAFIGNEVKEGQLLAVIDSSELGQAKIEYLTAVQALDQAKADLERQRTISTNTEALLAILKMSPPLDELQAKAAGLRVGENKGRLIVAYAKMKTARANHEREQTLSKQNLSTQTELLAAEEAANSAAAEYFAASEDISFKYQVQLKQAEQAFRVAESAVSNAERRLHLLGLTDEKVRSIRDEPDTDIARYELRSTLAGRVINKHITVGEKIAGDEPVYTVVNLATVWLNISVYAKYLGDIREGQPVTGTAGDRQVTGYLSYISENLSESTRTVIARVVLDNQDRRWRPGEFVTVHIETSKAQVDRAVPVEAIQTFEGKQVVFVQDEDGIEPHPVRLGRRDEENVELLDGPARDAPIVVKNSFLMKSELGKSAAGHEH